MATCAILFISSLTVVFAGLTALLQSDIKKIIAYSTCSQLGYMLFICGFNHYSYSFLHLINHAFFKALLFLTAGVIIHTFKDEQDIRKFSLLVAQAPLIFCLFYISTLSITG